MDIDKTLNDMFAMAKESKRVPKKDTSDFELKSIETKMNQYLKNKQKLKYERVSLHNFDDKKQYNKEDFNLLIDKEINMKYKTKKKFTSLPLFLRWKLVQDYINTENITDDSIILSYKNLVQNNKLICDYDDIDMKILKINTYILNNNVMC